MNTYIVFDLEWNQSAGGRETAIKELPFEIIEIGAVKLNENREVIDTFRRLIRPAVYKTLHFKVLEVVNIGQEELRKDGISFRKAGREFVNWCFDPDEEGNYRYASSTDPGAWRARRDRCLQRIRIFDKNSI